MSLCLQKSQFTVTGPVGQPGVSARPGVMEAFRHAGGSATGHGVEERRSSVWAIRRSGVCVTLTAVMVSFLIPSKLVYMYIYSDVWV